MLSDKKGIALLVVIGLVLMLLILGSAGLMISTGHFGTSFRQIKRARAYYAAEAAMQHALWKLRTTGAATGTLALPLDFEVNGIEDADITVTIGDFEAELPGVRRINVTLSDY